MDAARKLGESTVRLQICREASGELRGQIRASQEEISEMKKKIQQNAKEIESRGRNNDRLLHGVEELQARIAQTEEEVRMLEEEQASCLSKQAAIDANSQAIKEEIQRAQVALKEQEAERERCLVAEGLCNDQLKAVLEEKKMSSKEQLSLVAMLRKLKSSTAKCERTSQFVETLLQTA